MNLRCTGSLFFRHDRSLYGELCKLVYRMMERFYTEAAGRAIQGAAVIAYASSGDFVRWNPHLHAVFLEGGFDGDRRFVHVPSLDLVKLSQYFRSTLISESPLRCARCGSNMKVITDPQQEVRRILRHLIKTGPAPPDPDLPSVS